MSSAKPSREYSAGVGAPRRPSVGAGGAAAAGGTPTEAPPAPPDGGEREGTADRVRLAPLLRAPQPTGGPLLAPLRARPGRSPREVWGNQRVRLFLAMLRAVQARGYRGTTVRELCALAGVSTRTLYERFPGGKQACFLALFDMITGVAARRIFRVRESQLAWRERLELIVTAFAEQVAKEPEAAQLAMVDSFVAGARARAEIDRIRARFEAFVAGLFAEAPDGVGLHPLLVKAVVAGTAHVARSLLLAGRAAELPGEAAALTRWMLSYRSPAAEAAVRPRALPPAALCGPTPSCTAQLEALGTRGQIMAAAIAIAAREGAAALSSDRLAAAAGVSRWTVTRHFPSAEACLLEAIETLMRAELAEIAGAAGGARSWSEGVCAASARALARVAADQEYARVAFVEVMALGAAGMRMRDRLLAGVGRLLARAMPPEAALPRGVALACAGAAWGLIFQATERGEAAKLSDYAGLFAFLFLAPALGGEEAARRIAEQATGARLP